MERGTKQMKTYGFNFKYRIHKDSEPIKERFFIESDKDNAWNDSEIAMLIFLKKRNYYSGKILSVIEF